MAAKRPLYPNPHFRNGPDSPGTLKDVMNELSKMLSLMSGK